ncbi:hypothetical protein EQG49_03580 [Periweissella cryptocerci]|uniref:Uncharacterized protein n=1 Tax=Periweissella cryptocerci TaxID=2506420 RepID=A0A4P6YSK5_9LACO|nr:CDP-glycerol glycerophosphotransferase family protein [Periweissella cryptocerci]QBO35603.1 hypothetical protein EQG49_03580 [Periweissella cryptocerci]
MKNTWIFGASDFIGNPKWLYQYINQFRNDIEIWWIADNKNRLQEIKKANPEINIVLRDSTQASRLYKTASVYVEDQFREYYPEELNENIVFLNLWHGVGLKKIEMNSPFNGTLSTRIMKKYIKYTDIFSRRTLFLSTSEEMDKHFADNVMVPEERFIKGGYPRVELNKIVNSNAVDLRQAAGVSSDTKVVMFAPTYRDAGITGSFDMLIPDMNAVYDALEASNSMLIINLHPKMRTDGTYQQILKEFVDKPRTVFIENGQDIYELFNQIDYTIIDYSSIFYDLMASGQDHFVRYTPDFEEYLSYQPLMERYYDETYGEVVNDFETLLQILRSPNMDAMLDTAARNRIQEYFFSHANGRDGIDAMIDFVLQYKLPANEGLPTLHSYDIFDTLIKRTVGVPEGIFFYVQEQLRESGLNFPRYVIDNYPEVRHQAEFDARDYKRKTQFERESDVIEIEFMDIFNRMAEIHSLNQEQVNFLAEKEKEIEIKNADPIDWRIEQIEEQLANGDEVVLISDMYLPYETVKAMLHHADARLDKLPLYLSTDVGYQKTTLLLFKYVFFNMRYHFEHWVHYGDNPRADKRAPKRLGIETVNHKLMGFNDYEQSLVEKVRSYESYLVANIFRKDRRSKTYVDANTQVRAERYFAKGYTGLYLVPYVDWAIRRAINDNVDTMYFISRDGVFLKELADAIIDEQGLSMKTKLIYGSRKAWRIPGYVHEVDDAAFSVFGLFQSSVKKYEDILRTGILTDDEFDEFFPMLGDLKVKQTPYTGRDRDRIRSAAKNSKGYREHLVKIGAERRELVRDYLKSEINFDEKFVFVEFWGRGYTQDSLTNLLEDAAGREIPTEFYYARSIYGTTGHSIRTRFTSDAASLTFIESIFARVPMNSLTEYERTADGKVVPVIEDRPNKFARKFSKHTVSFAKRYARLEVKNRILLDRELFDFAINYFHENPDDENIIRVFAPLEDNIALDGTPEQYAPLIRAKSALFKPIKELKRGTRSFDMSVARSSKKVQFIIERKIEFAAWQRKRKRLKDKKN